MIECVTTCVNYSDFLAETVKHNRHLFDRMVVVTAPEDKRTRRICEFWHVECVPTDVFRSRWGEFHKGSAINVGLATLKLTDWVIHLDADILLPPLTRKLLDLHKLDNSYIYGIDRHICKSHEAWSEFLAMPTLQHEDETWVHLDKFPIGARFAPHKAGMGYIPIGFFQMWHPVGSGISKYPEFRDGAATTDFVFATKWPREKRALIPEIIAYHLESEPAVKGANWNGRTTTQFGPEGKLDPPVAPAKGSGSGY